MAKSNANIVRDILKAHGFHDVEPNDEAKRILADALEAAYREGSSDAVTDSPNWF